MLSLLSGKNKKPPSIFLSSSSAPPPKTPSTDAAEREAAIAFLNQSLETLNDVFPNADVDDFRRMLSTCSEESRLYVITEILLREGKQGPHGARGGKLEPWQKFRSDSYQQAVKTLLSKEFKWLAKSTILAVMAEHNFDYSRSRSTLAGIAAKSWLFSFSKIFRRAPSTVSEEPKTTATGCEELDAEIFAMGKPAREKQISEDLNIAKLLNEAEHAAASELVECECCYGDYSWDETAACAEGHFFCHNCLLKSVQEGLYGQGRNLLGEKCSIRCISSAAVPPCETFVPLDLLAAVLPPDVFHSLEEKTAAECVDKSGLDLVKCPFCAYAEVNDVQPYRFKRSAIIPLLLMLLIMAPLVPFAIGALLYTIAFILSIQQLLISEWISALICSSTLLCIPRIKTRVDKVAKKIQRRRRGALFKCCNSRCGRSSCVECSKEWKPFHKCYEKEEDSVRIYVEKAMADAVKRTCPVCNISFVKSDGCNKLTCPCGYVMCYICRADIRTTGYRHFCQHFRQVPGTACTDCDQCDLYVQEDTTATIRKAAAEAEEEYFRRYEKPVGWVYKRGKVGPDGIDIAGKVGGEVSTGGGGGAGSGGGLLGIMERWEEAVLHEVLE